MRVIGILAILIIAMFVVTLSFMTINDNHHSSPELQNIEASSTGDSDVSNGGSVAVGFPTQQEYQLQYMREQLKNQGSETELSYQQHLEQARMEYQNLMLQQKLLHEKDVLSSKNSHEEKLLKQSLQKEYILKQQDSTLLSQEKRFEAEMAERLIAFETRKQLLEQQHQQALVQQNNSVFEHSLITYTVLISSAIFVLSLSYFVVSARIASKKNELIRLEQEHIYSLKQQESMQETRIKVLESISDLPEQDKKEIIVGLVGLNRPFEELENTVVEEPPIEIELTELTPPQMKVSRSSSESAA